MPDPVSWKVAERGWKVLDVSGNELGYVEDIAWSLISLGAIARYQGAPGWAAALLAESRSLSERIGFQEGLAW